MPSIPEHSEILESQDCVERPCVESRDRERGEKKKKKNKEMHIGERQALTV